MKISEELQARKEYLLRPDIRWMPHSPREENQACLVLNRQYGMTQEGVSMAVSSFLFQHLGESPGTWNDSHTFSQVVVMLDLAILNAKEQDL